MIAVPIDDLYFITDFGAVIRPSYSDKKKRLLIERGLPQALSEEGYPTVNFNSKNHFVHRLIAQAFIPNPDNKPYVNHKNGNRKDYSIPNLEWCTHQENQIHSYKVLGRRSNTLGKFGHMSRVGRPVNQYDIDGNFITQYGSLQYASHSIGKHRYTIQWAIDKKGGYYAGSYWAYAN